MYKLKEKTVRLVFAGFWNKAIFNINWINKYLLKDTSIPENKTNVSISLPLQFIFNFDEKIIMEVQDKVIVFLALEDTENNYKNLTKIAINLLRTLFHTPILAYGINFEFILDKNSFQNELNNNISLNFKNIGNLDFFNLRYSYKMKQDEVLNIDLFSNTEKMIKFNWHYSIQEKTNIEVFSKDEIEEKIIKKLEEGLINKKSETEKILDKLLKNI